MQRIEHRACFGGWQDVYEHASATLGCTMRFAIYLPPQADVSHPQHGHVPVLYWLSGLTCTEQNFITKAGAQRYAAEHGIAIVAPDTSPRGDDVADAEGYDLGKGAGFYVNATQAPWVAHYRMHDYVVEELPALVEANFPVTARARSAGIRWADTVRWCSRCATRDAIAACRRSRRSSRRRGCHGARKPSPPTWARSRDMARVGCVRSGGAAHRRKLPLLVDQGGDDEFLDGAAAPELLQAACGRRPASAGTAHARPGYDHSYYFIASFIGEHVAHHAAALRGGA
jgi:S-formylglutathione hydrolase